MHGPWLLIAQLVRVSAAATLISLAGGLWLGHWLARSPRWRGGFPAAGFVLLILPPAVICAYLLAPVFTEPVAMAAATVYGLPFLARASARAFRSVDPDYANAARTTGGGEWRIFWRISLPLAARPLAGAAGIVFGRIATEYAVALWMVARGVDL
jgi:ABC-type molybdate transport system permease subunit